MSNFQGHFEDSSGNLVLPIPAGAAATVETGANASQAYTKGSYLYHGDRFKKVTSAIASGDAISGKVSETTIGTEMAAHFVASNGTEFSFQTLINGGYN